MQSATLHILCQREQQIQAFVPQDYWSVFVDYAEGFRAYYRGSATDNPKKPKALKPEEAEDEAGDTSPNPAQGADHTAGSAESDRVLSQAEADRLVQLAQQFPHQVKSIEGKTVSRTPPPPFITSTLQQAAGTRLRFSPEKTMQVAQALYEAGLIT